MEYYQVAVIGGGPAGYSAAIRAQALGASTCLIEKGVLGGVCLNEGCIPTKFLINTLKSYRHAAHLVKKNIIASVGELHVAALQKEKQKIVGELTGGLAHLLRAKKIAVIQGTASFKDASTLTIVESSTGAARELRAEKIIIATGAVATYPAALVPDGKTIFSAKQILDFDMVYRRLVIVGGGIIGCELAHLFSLLGSRVTIVEKEPRMVPQEKNDEIAKILSVSFIKHDITVITGTEVASVERRVNALTLHLKNHESIEADACVVATGKRPYLERLGLEAYANIDNGFVKNRGVRTSGRNIFIAGDVLGKNLYAYTAYAQGIMAAELAVRNRLLKEQKEIPVCIFTDPEVAYVGLTEQGARAKGLKVKTFKLRYAASGRAKIDDAADGFIKVIADTKSKRLLGAVVVGPQASELINTLALLLHTRTPLRAIASLVFIHPTYSENIKEALLGLGGFPFHSM